ncbi:MAG: valine--tRNA ligase [Mycoplasmataceae bacterium]|nr:valine--tRNA ligase [Mycoplasmataceae bacterium]
MNGKYNPRELEQKIQLFWKENNFFKTSNDEKKTFTILMPPPNVTGDLHLGHAWDLYYPDLLIRLKQLKGYEAIWYPGMDHAGIATQSVVEKRLFLDEKKTRQDLGREKFIKQIWDWKNEYAKNIEKQWDKIGIIADFEKQKFSLDKDVNKLVIDSFIHFHEKGLIYQNKKLVNWDVKLKTVISNIEVDHHEVDGKMYYVYYQLYESDQKIIIATTRPETIFADSALVVNPSDKRHKDLIGKKALNPLTKKLIPIISDNYVEKEFGTGIMKVTPSHDFNDYELGIKYGLPFTNIFNLDGTLNEKTLQFKGLDRENGRKKVVAFLKQNQLLEKIIDHKHFVGFSQRSQTIIEPLISTQWFLRSSILARNALNEQKKHNKITFYPKRFESVFINWMDGMEDWCISRQLWWGHQIPVWKKDREIKVQAISPGKEWVQEDDVLDTWYSSALWPLIFRDEAVIARQDDSNFLSTILFTGYDIILFWVSRMIFQTLELDSEKRPPFKTVINHGLIRDKNGLKMSKSLGNGINPMTVIDKWGSDALRISLLANSSPGQDIRFQEEKVQSAWDLNNKLFNATKLISSLIIKSKFKTKLIRTKATKIDLNEIDQYILQKLNSLLKNIDLNVEKYNLNLIFAEIKKFIFSDFANTYLEFIKLINDEKQLTTTMNILIDILILLHPFIPFLTEELYLELNQFVDLKKSILLEEYPKVFALDSNNENKELDALLVGYRAYNKAKLVKGYQKNDSIELFFPQLDKAKLLSKYLSHLNVSIIVEEKPKEASGILIDPKIGIIYYLIKTSKLLLIEELKKTATSELNNELTRAKNLLKNPNFINKAAKEVVTKERNKHAFYKQCLKIIQHEN